MALIDQTVSLKFGGGVDTKSDPKTVLTSKLTLLKNGIFTDANQVAKRNGYDSLPLSIVGGGTISSPTMCTSYRNELLLAATGSNGQRLFSYSPELLAWSDRGKYLSIAVSKTNIASIDQSGSNADGGTPSGGFQNSTCAILNNIAVFAYSVAEPNPQIYITVVDQQSGMQLASNLAISGAESLPKVFLLAGSSFALTYKDSSGFLQLVVISVTKSGGVAVGSPIAIADPVLGISTYDVMGTSSGAVAAYAGASPKTLELQLIDSSGNPSGSAVSIGSPGTASPISLTTDTSSNIWVYWADSATTSSEPLYYAVYSSSLSSVLAKTSITTGLNEVTQITAYYAGSSTQELFYSTYSGSIPSINTVSVTSGGTVGSPSVWLNHVDIYGKIVSANSTNYIAVMFVSSLFPTGFLVDIQDALPVAKFLPDSAEGINASGSANVQRSPGFINQIISLSSTELFLCSGYIPGGGLATSTITSGTGYSVNYQGATLAVCGITFDFDNIDAYQAIVQQDSLLTNGGIVGHYDGAAQAELGFSVDPEIASVTTSTTGGVLGSGQWIYYVTYEWIDANGNLHQSAPSTGYYVSFGSGSANQATINARTLSLTQKSNVNVVFWRTQSNLLIAYRIASVPNSTTSDTVQYVDDTLTDADIANNTTLYTEGGAILENIAPPPAMVMWVNNNRAWLVDSENPETTIEYSKTAAQGYGVSFSTGQLELVIDSKAGAISGASPMDEKTVLLKEKGICFFIGDGANDSGTGSTISNIQFVPTDTGCTNSKSVVLFPQGVVYRSPKGLYLLNRGISVSYFGPEVQAYNAQDVQSAIISGGKSTQIRLLTSSGDSLLYDYFFGQWSAFTNHEGLSACSWTPPGESNPYYVYVRTDGSVYLENYTSYLDDSTVYQLVAQTAWIKASAIQNYQRLRRFAMLGDYSGASGHGVQVSAAYDWSSEFDSPVQYLFDGSSSVFQYRERLSQQKCDAVQLLIEEVTTGASGEYIDFTDLGIEIGLKKGLRKLGASQTVG